MQVDMQTIIFVFLTLSITNPRVVLCFANAQPTTYKNGTNVTQMELPSEFYQDMEHGIFYAIRNRQTQDTKLPFMLIKTYNLGSFSDGTLGLFMVTSSKMSFLRRLEGFGTLRSNIVYFDNGMAYFTIAGGTLFSIDGSTQEINEVKKFTDDPIRWVGEESYLDKFCILQDSMYFAANQTELWKSDGTSKGTIMVEELNDTINSMSVVNDDYLLLAMGSNQILVSDGSSASTILTTEVEAPLLRGWRQSLIEGNRKALFLLNTGVWATEGTPETTIKISNLRGLIYQHVLLVQFDESYLVKSRILFAFDDGTLLLSLQRTADDPVEFWTILLLDAADDAGESGRTNDEESERNNQDDPQA